MPTLMTSDTSPYGRKVRMVIDILGLADTVPVQTVTLSDPNDPVHRHNPLSKMPVLVLDDGSPVYDSRVIVEFLDTAHGDGAIVPRDPAKRVRALTNAALAEGIMDSLIQIRMEGVFHEGAQVSEKFLERQRGKVTRGLAHITENLDEFKAPGIAAIGLACALAYIDWRKHLEWRPDFPGLVAWLDAFASEVPAFKRTHADI